MCNYSFFKQILFIATVILFVSCDKEYNEIGADLIGQNNFALKDTTFAVVAYNQKIEAIQSNNLPVNALGIYENSAFGTTTASFVTQVSLATVNPIIDTALRPKIDSVYVEIPYFVDATKTATKTAGGYTYELDSIYEKVSKSKIKLEIYQSKYFMRDLNPDDQFKSSQKYYTNQKVDFENNKGDLLYKNDTFFFDNAQIVKTISDEAGIETNKYSVPAMRLKLDTVFFNKNILKSGKLVTNEAFKDHFRGLYFKVEKSGSDSGSLAMMDFSKGVITISYHQDTSTTDKTPDEKSIVLNLSGNTVSLQDNPTYNPATSYPDKDGDKKLYLKGGEGSMAVISLFGADNFGADGLTGSPNSVADELDIIRKNGWLINEAKLVFHIDAEAMGESPKPQRIYLYDMTNNLPISDYFNDFTSGTTSKNGKLIFDGILNKTKSTYTIRITNHIRNLINDATKNNVKLGVVVTEDINTIAFSKFKDKNIFAPTASVMNPLGTILHGSKSTVPVDKRLKLEIYYTKPN
jgi:hypothetical protein